MAADKNNYKITLKIKTKLEMVFTTLNLRILINSYFFFLDQSCVVFQQICYRIKIIFTYTYYNKEC
ncbi:MAG: hypothetical protein A2096_17290 [Spirochaetes bacterium GWF1_41_5]|nr:MAG: hypothetical protein A2096_17290 [Spirochaetes bacterium GWF1_41_5]